MTEERHLTPREAAACLVAILQRRGAVFSLTAAGYVHCNLDPSDVSTHEEAEDLAQCVLALREEIKALLREDRVQH